MDLRKGAIGLSENEEVNMLFAKKVKEVGKISRIYVGLKRDDEGITAEMVDEIGGRIPFARAMDLEKWSLWVRKEQVEAMTLIYNVDEEKIASDVFKEREKKGSSFKSKECC